MKVLIIEDEPLLAMSLETIIEDAGHEVAGIAVDMKDAMAKAHLAECAFVDCHLRDGYTGPAIAQTLANDFEIPVFHITANRDLVEDNLGRVLGVIGKPYPWDAVTDALAVAEGHRSAGMIGRSV
ncbi:response regulator [Agrobacterium rubi]|nr:response regulator [Agrobacterium rubi]NTF25054.1 response regulator [Agrobacterium rubi]